MKFVLRAEAATIKAATAYIALHHRHAKPPRGGLFAVFVARLEVAADGTERWVRCGAGIAGRPASRHLQSAGYLEMTRIATDGTPNASSFLLGALWRAGRALGWARAVTYTLATESGASLRGAGWRPAGQVKLEQWGRDGRPRDGREEVPRVRWIIEHSGER